MKILVALDGSDHALVGLGFVACMPLEPDDEVILVSVAETDPISARSIRRQHGRHMALLLQASWAAQREAAERTVAQGRTRLGDWRTPVSQVVRSGHPVKVIADLVGEFGADLLVLGPRGRGQLTALLLGSVTQSLLGLARCPLVVAREPVNPVRRVILAVDGSAHSGAATRILAAFPLPGGARVDVISVATPWMADLDGVAGGPGELLAAHQETAAETATRAVTFLTAAGLEAEATVRTGDPGREVVQTARSTNANLVVLGSRGLGGVKGLLVGSVSRRVVATAPCSVLVVPAPRRPTLPRGRDGTRPVTSS